MKEYRVSLEVVTSVDVTRSELSRWLGVPRPSLAQEQRRRGILWRYEPSAGQTGKLRDRIRQLAAEVRPRRPLPRGGGFRRVSLGIDVSYDTASCTVVVPLHLLAYGANAVRTSIPELSSVDLRCSLSDEELAPSDWDGELTHDPERTWEEMRRVAKAWESLGRPAPPRARRPLVMDQSRMRFAAKGSARSSRRDTNKYIVSLDAITSASATRSEVADVLGLPPASLTKRRTRRPQYTGGGAGALWQCFVEADQTVGLAERIRFLASQVHPRRPFQRDGGTDLIFLDIGVIYDARRTETCSVRIPVSGLRSLVRKLFVFDVEVSCYP